MTDTSHIIKRPMRSIDIYTRVAAGESGASLAREYKVSRQNISAIFTRIRKQINAVRLEGHTLSLTVYGARDGEAILLVSQMSQIITPYRKQDLSR